MLLPLVGILVVDALYSTDMALFSASAVYVAVFVAFAAFVGIKKTLLPAYLSGVEVHVPMHCIAGWLVVV